MNGTRGIALIGKQARSFYWHKDQSVCCLISQVHSLSDYINCNDRSNLYGSLLWVRVHCSSCLHPYSCTHLAPSLGVHAADAADMGSHHDLQGRGLDVFHCGRDVRCARRPSLCCVGRRIYCLLALQINLFTYA